MINSPILRALTFRLRAAAFALPLLLSILYYRYIAPRFGNDHVRRVRVALPRTFSGVFLRMYKIRTHLSGMQHLQHGPGHRRILMVNHNSRFDAYILLALLDFPFKAFWSNTAHVTSEGFKLLAWFGHTFDMFFVHDKSDKRRTLQEFKLAEAYVKAGGTLSMFPEGAYSSDGSVGDFGTACAGLAVRTGAVIVPIVMSGTQAVYEKPKQRGGLNDVYIRVLPPIATQGLQRADILSLTEGIVSRMNTELRSMQAEAESPAGRI